MPPEPLTDRQREVLAFIAAFTERHGYPPTYRDIMRPFGFASTNAVADHLRLMARKGAVEWATDRNGRMLARTLRVLNTQSPAR